MTEQIPAEKAQSGKNNTKTTNAPKGLSLWPLYCLVLLLAVGIGVAGSGLWYQHKADISALQQKLAERPNAKATSISAEGVSKVEFATVEADLQTLREQLVLSQAQAPSITLEATVKALAMQVASVKSQLQSQTDTNRDDWKLAEAEFLLHLASQRALLAHNSHEALMLTQTVDDILRERSDPQLFPVRQVLADEIAALKNITPVDTEGVYLRLQALKNSVVKLKLVKPFERAEIQDATKALESPVVDTTSAWGKIQTSAKKAIIVLASYVRVREHEAVVEPLLTPEYTYYLQQNLMLMLEQAQSALLREEAKVYQESLSKAQAWISQYFTHSIDAENAKREISALKEIQLAANLPDISKALRLLKIYIHDVHNVVPDIPAAKAEGEAS